MSPSNRVEERFGKNVCDLEQSFKVEEMNICHPDNLGRPVGVNPVRTLHVTYCF